MWKTLLLLLTLMDVQVERLDGNILQGRLSALTPQQLTINREGRPEDLPLSDVISVTWLSPAGIDVPENSGQVILNDQSTVTAGLQLLTAQEVTIETASAGPVTIPRDTLRAVRLAEANQDWEEEWMAFQQRNNEQDLLILKKRDGSGLDFYDGVISRTLDDKVEFVLDGDPVPVPRERIYGLIFAKADSAGSGRVTVRLTDQSEITARDVSLSEERLTLETTWGQQWQLSADRVREIDFSSGRFHYLSDLDPVKESYFRLHPEGSLLSELLKDDDALKADALKLWTMHRDGIPMGPFGPLPLTLRGTVYRKGLWLFPHCRIDYALDGQYSAFQAIAGVDDEVAFNSSNPDDPSRVQLTILADGDPVWDQQLAAHAEPVSINLDMTSVRTLSIEVNFGDDDSVCDFLDLANARLLVVP